MAVSGIKVCARLDVDKLLIVSDLGGYHANADGLLAFKHFGLLNEGRRMLLGRQRERSSQSHREVSDNRIQQPRSRQLADDGK